MCAWWSATGSRICRRRSTRSGSCGGPDVRDPFLRNMFRYASRRYWDQIAKDIRPVCTASKESEFTANSRGRELR
jgi:hypothetical protein